MFPLYSVTRQLALCACYRPPHTLLGDRVSQGEFIGYQPLYQTFGVGEVVLAPPPARSSAVLAPDVVFPTSGSHPPASGRPASSAIPVLPRLASSTAPRLPRQPVAANRWRYRK